MMPEIITNIQRSHLQLTQILYKPGSWSSKIIRIGDPFKFRSLSGFKPPVSIDYIVYILLNISILHLIHQCLIIHLSTQTIKK